MRKEYFPIVRVSNRKIIIESKNNTLHGSTMEQLTILLQPYGYVKVNQNEIVKIDKIKNVFNEERIIVLGESERLHCIVSRRNWFKILNFLQNVDK